MRLAASNIAWDAGDEASVAALLSREGFTGVELAPTKWREDAYSAPAADIRAYRGEWEDRGLRVVALQALLFGRPDLQLFGDAAVRAALADHLRRAIDFAALLGARALVFGSPKNRVRGAMPMDVAVRIASDFFWDLGHHAAERGCAIAIEANPPAYGCDFITTTSEAIALCRGVGHESIGLNLDVGTLTMNSEDARSTIAEARPFIAHVHASEPRLAPLERDGRHDAAAAALRAVGYDGWVSLEMRGDQSTRDDLASSVAVARAAYLGQNVQASFRADD